VKNMPQTQVQTNVNKIKEFFQKAKVRLPMEVFDFKEFVVQELNCEFWYDENAEPSERVKIAENIIANVYEKEFNVLACEEKENIDVVFKNAIYIYDHENNRIILLHYEDVEVTSPAPSLGE
jgi:hypothetical protein